MRQVRVNGTFESWRDQARVLLQLGASPEDVIWTETEELQEPLENLFAEPSGSETSDQVPSVPKGFLDLASKVACHRDQGRWRILYRVLDRLTHGEKHLLAVASDPDVNALQLMDKSVRRDMHKMRAFVRFRKIGEDFVAWHRPDHHILEANVPFFVRRFGSMRWAILTPERSAYWDMEVVRFGPGVPRPAELSEDGLEELWLTYYASIFNPARVKVRAMKAEMPVRYWSTMPETRLIPELLDQAAARVSKMAASSPRSAQPFVPATTDLEELREAARSCRGCDLCLHATQTVFGEGSSNARVILIGEQPGDQEDLQGRPFVGPAGLLLDRALEEAGVDRSLLYVTNAVKHFKFSPRGKRRIHEKPTGTEIAACRPWLEAEVRSLQPELLVCLGATAGQSVFGRAVKVMSERGRVMPHHWAKSALLTIHPSMLLRIPEPDRKEEEYAKFVADLEQIRAAS